MKYCLFVENNNSIDFTNFKDFCKTYNPNIDIKIEENDYYKRITYIEKNKEITLILNLKRRDLNKNCELNEFRKKIINCNYYYEIFTENEEEIRIVFELAIFISKYTYMVLLDDTRNVFYHGNELNTLSTNEIVRMIETSKIQVEYKKRASDIYMRLIECRKNNGYKIILCTLLILLTITIIFKITNAFILFGILLITSILVLHNTKKNINLINNYNKDIRINNYEKEKELARINNNKIPKIPSICYEENKQSLLYRILKKNKVEKNIKRETIDLINKCNDVKIIDDIEGIKFELTEIETHKYRLSVLGYVNLDTTNVNKINNGNKMITINNMSVDFTCNENWEIIEETIVKKTITDYLEKHNELKRRINAITYGFKDSKEQLLYNNMI